MQKIGRTLCAVLFLGVIKSRFVPYKIADPGMDSVLSRSMAEPFRTAGLRGEQGALHVCDDG